MKIVGLILSVMLTASVACSLSVLHKNLKNTGVSHTSSRKPVARPVSVVASHPKSGLPDRASTGASRLAPDDERAFLDYAQVSSRSLNISDRGDADAKQGNWAQAQGYYQQALAIWPDNSAALYGLGQCAATAGDTASAVRYYRTATYSDASPHTAYNTQTKDVARLMEFVLLLGKAKQEQEALTVYQRAAHLLNYQDAQFNGGKPYLDVMLPEFGGGPSELTYTPQRLAAMAHVGIAYEREDLDHKLAQTELQKAIDSAPDSPVPYFYKGQSIIRAGGHRREALTDFQTAAQLGNDDTKAAVDKKLKDYSIERDAKVEQDMEDTQKNKVMPKK